MSDGYIDLSPILRAVNAVSASVAHVSGQVEAVGNYVAQIDQRVVKLEQDFKQMMKEQRMNAAFQRAITEIIRVRQELEQKFGNHKQVRDNLIGILEAHDLALVKEATISRCSEELMLNTPKYWLSPCLIALAGWLGNDEALAKRAIAEAVKRDREKTCLLFALICRRNGRTDTCFEWLREYFKLQNPKRMKSSIVAFIGAYYNGIFGEDKDNVCLDQITAWMDQLKEANPEFDEQQKAYWKNFFNFKCEEAKRRIGKNENYLLLEKFSKDGHDKMENFIKRIELVNGEGGAKDKFKQIVTAPIDHELLIKQIDDRLKALVTEFEADEFSLREEELFLEFVKEYKGDEIRAAAKLQIYKAKFRDDPLDLAERLSVAAADENKPAAERKASLMLLRQYIVDAYAEYITENKDAYPETINLTNVDKINIEGEDTWVYKNADNNIRWVGETANAENRKELEESVAKVYNAKKEAELAKVKVPVWSWIMLVIPGLIASSKAKKIKASIEQKYEEQKKYTISMLDKALDGRVMANKFVADFCGQDGWDKIEIKEA